MAEQKCPPDVVVVTEIPLVAAILSVLSYLFIFYLYFFKKLPTLKRHPTSLAVYKSVFELIYCVQFLWLNFLPSGVYFDYKEQENGDLLCPATTFAAVSAFVMQFSLIGGELWFLVLTMDLHLATTNPFISYKQIATRYHALVYGGSLISSVALMLAGNKVYGLGSDSTSWIQDESESNRYSKALFFYVWMAIIYTYCLYVVLFVFRRLKEGLSETLTTRLSVVKRAQSYVLGYTVFWAFPLSLYLIDYVVKKRTSGGTAGLQTSAVTILAGRGVISLIILLLPNYHEIKQSYQATSSEQLVETIVKEETSQKPHLNTALRAEILYFTTQGIRCAIANVEKEREEANRITENTGGSSSAKPGTLSREESSSRDVGESRVFSGFQLARRKSARGPVEQEEDPDEAIKKFENEQRESVMYDVRNEEREIRTNLALPAHSSQSAKQRKKRSSSLDFTGSATGRGGDASEFRLNVSGGPMDKSNWEKVEDGDGPRASTRHPSFDIEKGPSIDDNVKRQPSSRSGLSDLLEPVKAAADRLIAAVPKRVEVENFVFKDFLPHLFADVRQLCKINPNEYADSFLQTTKEKFSEGRSGAFLYFSSDLRYIVKTTTADESFALRSIMPQYVEYIRSNPNSLMVRFLGCHSLTLYGRTLHFVVMLNVFHGAQFSERFDLKGSWVNRHGDSRDMGRKSDKNTSSPLYKDSDLHNKISLPKGKQKNLRNQIARDTEFLRDLGLMDYSLLIGVIRRRFEVVDNAVSRDTDELGRDHNGAFNAAMVEGPGSYHMGIIDILQEWNWDKKLERFFKIYFRFSDPDGLSAIPPDRYQARFMQRAVIEVFEGMDEGQDETNSESSTDRGSVSNRRYSVTPVGGYSQNHSPTPASSAPPPSTSPKTSSFEVMSPLCEMD